jgi:hypothetical protein
MSLRRRLSSLLALAVVLPLMLALGLALASGEARAERRALVVGINAYSNGVSPLRGSVNDARMMYDFLIKRAGFAPSQVRLLLDGQATRAAILAGIDEFLIAGSAPGDPVVFFYSGHGAQTRDGGDDEPDGLDETLVPVDAAVRGGAVVNQIIDDELDARFRRLEDRRLTAIFDSCHSGTVTRSVVPLDGGDGAAGPRTPVFEGVVAPSVSRSAIAAHRKEETLLKASPTRMVWSAVSSHQVAWDLGGKQPPSGLFTPLLIEALSRGDGRMPVVEILDHARRGSEAFCRRKPGGCPLGVTPTVEIDRSLLTVPMMDLLQGRAPQSATAATVVALALQPGSPPVNAPTAAPAPQPPPPLPPGTPAVRITRLGAEGARLGASARFQVDSNFDGHLVLLDLRPADAAGRRELVQLYPNGFSGLPQAGVRTILAGRPFYLPATGDGFRLVVREPLGAGTLLALVTQDPVDLSSVVRIEARNLIVVTDGTDYLSGLVELLNKPFTGDVANRPSRWAIGHLPYTTTR